MRAAAGGAVALLLLALGAAAAPAGEVVAPSAGAYILGTGRLRRGDAVPKFKAVDIYGVEVDFAALLAAGKRPLLAFWSMYCKSCVDKFDAMVILQTRYGSQGLAVVSVNTDGEYRRGARAVREFVADYERRQGVRINFPVLYDEANWVPQAMGIEFLPTIVMVDDVGRVESFYQSFGEHGEEEILAGLETLVRKSLRLPAAGEETPVSTTGFGGEAPGRGGLKPGDPVPPIKARGIYGHEVDLGGMLARGDKLLLVFWSMYCESCVEKFKALAAVQQRYGPQGVKIVGVNTDGEYGHGADTVRRFITDFETANGLKILFPILYDEQNPLPQALHIEFLPTIVSVDPAGRVLSVYQKVGESSEDAILAGIEGVVREMLERFAARPAPVTTP